MKILVFSSHIRWITHYETELELIQGHIDRGDSVTHLYCSQALLPCDQNISSDPEICRDCMERRIFGQSLIRGDFKKIKLPRFKKHLHDSLLEFKSLKDLHNYKLDEFDLGLAVASSLTSIFRDPEIDLAQHIKLVNDFISNAESYYKYFQKLLLKISPDVVYIFNGRFAYDRALFKACLKLNIQAKIHERGSSIHKYMLYENVLPHNIANITSLINQCWDKNSNSIKNEIGEKFFFERINGTEQSWYSFIKNQKNNKLPENWDNSKRNIVIFNSSEDEFVAIGPEWKLAFYKNQYDGIKDIISIIKRSDSKEYRLYLRIHPNLSNVKNKSVSDLLNFSEDEIFVIPPDSDISTYELIYRAEKVISFGSTVGIEATFLKKPSILLGSSMYMNLNATYNPETKDEFINLLFQQLRPKEINNAIKYGYYMKTFGYDFKLFKAESVASGGQFKGKYLSNPEINFLSLKILKVLRNKKLISKGFFRKVYLSLLRCL